MEKIRKEESQKIVSSVGNCSRSPLLFGTWPRPKSRMAMSWIYPALGPPKPPPRPKRKLGDREWNEGDTMRQVETVGSHHLKKGENCVHYKYGIFIGSQMRL